MQNKAPFIIIGIIVALGVIGGVVYASMNQPKPHDHNDGTHSHPEEEMSSSSSASEVDADHAEATDSVEISNFNYGPQAITVKKGTTVTWTNNDSVEHDVQSDNGDDTLDGPLLAKGESWSYTFNEVGEFGYHCSPHPYMKGTVTVTE